MPRSILDIRNEILKAQQARGEINYFGEGSIIDSLATDIAVLVQENEALAEKMANEMRLDTASEDQVLLYARDFNVSRSQARRAIIEYGDQNLILSSTNNKSIATILNENNIVLPGIRVTDASKSKVYVIEYGDPSVNLNTATSVYVSAIALNVGASSNIAKNELNTLEKPYRGLSITNRYAVQSGRDIESIASLRLRVYNKLESNLSNEATINTVLSSIPGYGKSSIVRNYSGPGSILICVQPSNSLAFSNSSLQDIKNKLVPYVTSGSTLLVKNFSPVTLNIKTRIVVQAGSAAAVVDSLKQSIVSYVNQLEGGESLNILDLESVVKRNTAGLKMLSRFGNSFEEVKYTIAEGSANLSYIAEPRSTISVKPTEIITLDQIIINYES